MSQVAESRFHRIPAPGTAAKEQPACLPEKLKPFNAEDFIDIADLNDLPRIWG